MLNFLGVGYCLVVGQRKDKEVVELGIDFWDGVLLIGWVEL